MIFYNDLTDFVIMFFFFKSNFLLTYFYIWIEHLNLNQKPVMKGS